MRNLLNLTLTLLSIHFTTLPLFAEYHGGGGPGGGNNLEAAFKKHIVLLAEELVLDADNGVLNFDPRDLLSMANQAQPKCALGEEILLLKSQKKLAYVKDLKSKIILLDCGGYEKGIPQVWNQYFDKNNSEARVLSVHELLRLIGSEGEDSYLKSGRVATFDLNKKKKRQKALQMMFTDTTRSVKCYLRFQESEACFSGIADRGKPCIVAAQIVTDISRFPGPDDYRFRGGSNYFMALSEYVSLGEIPQGGPYGNNQLYESGRENIKSDLLSLNPSQQSMKVIDFIESLGCF